MINGVPGRLLLVHAGPGHLHARKASGIACQRRQSDLVGIPPCEACERGVGTRGLEEIEECRSADELAIQRGEWSGTVQKSAKGEGRDHVDPACARCCTHIGGRGDHAKRIIAGDARGQSIAKVLRQEFWICGINVSRPVHVHAVSIGIADAELVVVTQLTLNRQVPLLGVGILEIPRYGQRKWQKGDREAGLEKVLVVEEGAVLGVETLLVGQVRDAWDACCVQDALKDGCAISSRRVGGHGSPCRRATEDKEL